jgi:hypothetical protein
MKTRLMSLCLMVLALAVALPQAGQASVVSAAPRRDVTDADTHYIYLPLLAKPDVTCVTGQSYGSFVPAAGGDGAAENSFDKNLAMRGYITDTTKTPPFDYTNKNGTGDASAPRLTSLFSGAAAPFPRLYNVGKAPWDGTGYISDVLVGVTVSKGTQIKLPNRPGDHPVAQPGGSGTTKYYGLVLYATSSRITIVYISMDRIALPNNGGGYAVQLENVCIDPSLVELYTQLAAGGRHSLPALTYNQPFGVATSTEIKVAIRDNGKFMDPRSWMDWWRP